MKNNQVLRLSASYLAVIMAISIFFSVVIFAIFSVNMSQKPPRNQEGAEFQLREKEFFSFFENRLIEQQEYAKAQIISSLVVMNLAILVLGGFVSLGLARWTLRPIEENFELQSQFISDASHEIRTPLAAMLAVNQIALRKPKLTDQKSREILQKNVAEIQNLSNLAENLLNLTKVDKSDVKIEEFSSSVAIESVVEKLKNKAMMKNIKIEKSNFDCKIKSNRLAIGQILTIFLDNAIKYSDKNSIIKIRSKKDRRVAIFEVEDNGEGISKENQSRIFERFCRVDSARTRGEADKSHGLGLAIAKKLAEKNNFEIFVKSEIGKGSTFGIKIK
ncbi:MAG: HAMP domain-containing sensor histidine kinase [bacterium]|nr:HAMP domain-containing sensor histidine kinase [bacterium]